MKGGVAHAPERIGRYLVLEELGRGAHGVVYAAYDPRLDRKVAIKLLSFERATSPRAASARRRLLREARAMARISHPNVIPVFDSGEFEGPSGTDVYLVMELIDGQDLSRWLAELRRSEPDPQKRWGAILESFLLAGRGLAAAHAEGLVHRDFKPANVRVARDARVLVGDFGLVHSTEEATRARGPRAETPPGLTQSGELVGTPAYMSPEQHLGELTTPASDQFSFALALHEALFDEPAFAGDNPARRALAVLQGELRPFPKSPKLPKAIVEALQRALSTSTDERFETMDALLDALEPHRTGILPLGLGIGAALLAVLVLVAVFHRHDPGQLCEQGETQLHGVWDAQRRSALMRAWSSAPQGFVERSRMLVMGRLDAYAGNWIRERRMACRATRVLGIQSESRMERRMACLEVRRQELEALVEELLEPNLSLLQRAVASVESLSPLGACADAESLSGGRDESSGPEVARVLRGHARVRAQLAAGRLSEAKNTLNRLEEALNPREAPQLQAEQALLRGRLAEGQTDFEAAERALRQALLGSLRSGERRLAARAALNLARVLGLERSRHAEGLALWDIANALEPPHQENSPESLEVKAGLLAATGDRNAAIQTASVALASLQEDPLARARTRTTLAEVLVDARAYDQARPVLRAAIRDLKATLGEEHPLLIRPLTLLGQCLYSRDAYTEAEQHILRALGLATEIFGPEHPERAKVLLRYGPIQSQTGRLEQAVAHYQEALRILKAAYSEHHTVVARAHVNLGASYHRLGAHTKAAQNYRRAVEIREKIMGRSHPDLVVPLQNLGTLSVEKGRPAEAIPVLERAWHIRNSSFAPPTALADVDFWLGRALWASKRDRRRGVRLMRRALRVMRAHQAPAETFISDFLKEAGIPQ